MKKPTVVIPVKVTPIQGEALRYIVSSRSERGNHHMVDLSENKGNGECSCIDFITRRNVALKEGKPRFSAATMCYHIKAARKHFTDHTLTDMSAMIHSHGQA